MNHARDMANDKEIEDFVQDYLGGDVGILAGAIDLFARHRTEMTSQLEIALQKGKFAEIEFCAHRLKGALGSLGEKLATSILGEIEIQARAATLLAISVDFKSIVNAIDMWIVRVTKYIEKNARTNSRRSS